MPDEERVSIRADAVAPTPDAVRDDDRIGVVEKAGVTVPLGVPMTVPDADTLFCGVPLITMEADGE